MILYSQTTKGNRRSLIYSMSVCNKVDSYAEI